MGPGCGMGCSFCSRRSNDTGPRAGVSLSEAPAPDLAFDRVAGLVDAAQPPVRVELTGPGEPLVHAATPVLLRKLRWQYPDLRRSVWTNGLHLPDRLDELADAGAQSLVVSINAVRPETAERLYEWIIYRGRRYEGREAAVLLLRQQWTGLANALAAGLSVTVCSVMIPGVNDEDISLISGRARDLGADSVRTVRLPA